MTAVAEGLAQRINSGDVPAALQVRLHVLCIYPLMARRPHAQQGRQEQDLTGDMRTCMHGADVRRLKFLDQKSILKMCLLHLR